jgi:hypothetical protein
MSNPYLLNKTPKKTEEPKQKSKQSAAEDDSLLEQLNKMAISPELAKQWAADPCARPC